MFIARIGLFKECEPLSVVFANDLYYRIQRMLTHLVALIEKLPCSLRPR